ncbi:hypothetical protein BGW38_010682 [Lunasporangiospora selenospora]|uniref:Uncharacterized protein n=1 Tax=Lunasporangiospora selenospora TaxID=979761 RepID=A0A9P6KER4_9FUNG|nr:hypothetical protein BGW38_010682 [Lunasporangiospora selenospora]
MGEFEELRRVGTKHSRAAELELEKKKRELEHDEGQRKKQEEAYRKRKAVENQKLLRDELERKRHEEEQRRREAAALLKAKERAREREREKEVEERVRKQKATSNGPSYSRSKTSLSSTSGSASSRGYEPAKASLFPSNKEYSFDYIQKLAQSNGVDRVGKKSNGSDGPARSGDRPSSVPLNRQEAIDRHKVRTISPERTLAPASIAGPNFMKKTAIARRQAAPRSAFPVFRSAGASVNHIRDAGLKALRDGPIALNTVKRDRRSYEEISADVNDKSSRLEERERRIKTIEEEREKARLHRERVLQGARFSKALLGDNAAETERLQREIKGGVSKSSRDRSRSRSVSPPRRKRSKSPGRRRSLSPRPSKKRSYSPETRKRSISPHTRRKRSFSPPTARKKISKEQDDRDRDRGRGQGRDQDYNRESGTRAIKRPTNGSTKRRPSRSPSPRSSGHRRASPPRNAGKGRGRNDNDMSLHNVLGSLFGTRYRSRAEDEDLSDDMEARPDEVFREEARSARLGRLEDEKEAELEKAQMARKRKLAKEKERGRS